MITPRDVKEHAKDEMLVKIIEILWMVHDPTSTSTYCLDPEKVTDNMDRIPEVLELFCPKKKTAYRRGE